VQIKYEVDNKQIIQKRIRKTENSRNNKNKRKSYVNRLHSPQLSKTRNQRGSSPQFRRLQEKNKEVAQLLSQSPEYRKLMGR
jgi:hypothetical protein